MATEFQQLLRSTSGKYAKQQDLADALGISVARLNRAMSKGDYPLNVDNCLRLALVANVAPSTVLRAAGKGDLADLIERLYGRSDLTPLQREVLSAWDLLPAEVQAAVLVLLRSRRRRTGGSSPPQSEPPPGAATAARRQRRVV